MPPSGRARGRGAAAAYAAWRVFVLNVAGLAAVTLVARIGALAIEPGPRDDGEPFGPVLVAVLIGAGAGLLHAATQAVAVVYADRDAWHTACPFTAFVTSLPLLLAVLWFLGSVPATAYLFGLPFAVARWVVPDDRPPERR